MNAAQKLYIKIGGSAARVGLGSLRGWGIDLRNPHTRKAGPSRQGVHVQGTGLRARTTPRTRPNWQLNSVFSDRRNGFIAGE